jgi:ATP-dependent RNA helicase RhlE
LRKAGYNVEAIHSNRSQSQRKRSLDKFAKGEVNIITATDVLARGIDIDDVDYVINYDVPEQPEDYIHRIGRTGRAGAQGFAVTFVTPETESALRDIEKLVKKTIPEMKLESFDLAAAEAEAAEKAITAQSKRDPEVNRVKRELANRAQKASTQKKAPQRSGKGGEIGQLTKSSSGKGEKPAKTSKSAKSTTIGKKGKTTTTSRNGKATATRKAGKVAQTQKAAASRKQATRKQAQIGGRKQTQAGSRKQVQAGARKQSQASTKAKGDFRPGRAHRAEVQRSRSRRSQ